MAWYNILDISVSKRIGVGKEPRKSHHLPSAWKQIFNSWTGFFFLSIFKPYNTYLFLIIVVKIIKQWESFFDVVLSCKGRNHKWFRERTLEFEKSTPFIFYFRRQSVSCGDMQSYGKEEIGVIHLIFYTDSAFSVILLKQTLKKFRPGETHRGQPDPRRACCIPLHWRDWIAALGVRCQTPSVIKIQLLS